MKKAIIIHTNGEKEVVTFTDETCYKVISGAVGGYVERVFLSDECYMWCNEDGIAKGLPLNTTASAIYAQTFKVGNPVLGNVVLTGADDDEGNTKGLHDLDIVKWMRYRRAIIPTAYLLDPMYQESADN